MKSNRRIFVVVCAALVAGLCVLAGRDLSAQSSPTPEQKLAIIEKQLDELTRLVAELRRGPVPAGFRTVADAIQVEQKPAAQTVSSQPGYLGVQLAAESAGAIVIQAIEPDSPAHKAGLQPEDVVLFIDGQKASDVEQVKDLLQARPPGDSVPVKVQRKQETVEVVVTLTATSRPLMASGQRVPLGVRTTEQDEGVRIDRVTENSPAAKAGIKAGDLITKVDDAIVGAAARFSDILAEKKAGEKITLALQRDGAEQQIELTLPPPEENSSTFYWDNRSLTRWKKDVYRLAVVMVDYPDAEHNAKVTPAAWDQALFSRGEYFDKSVTGQKVFGSLNDYYLEQSCGAFHVAGKCFEPVKVERKRAEYMNDRVRTTLLTESLDKLLARDGGEALKDFDGVLFVYSGGRIETNRGGIYWPHRSSLTHKGRRLPYVVISDGGNQLSSISVICHEFGHLLGLPDLYARPENPGSEGLGGWCVMSNQNGNGRPQHFSAWCKEQLGWLKPAVIDPTVRQKLVLSPIENSPHECFKVLVRPDGSEYLLLENRMKSGFDTDLPGEGLLIWRVVDGRPQLEESHGIPGPAGPGSYRGVVPYPSRANNAFTPYTSPSSRSQKGGGLPVYITNIQRLPDGRLTFLVGFEFL